MESDKSVEKIAKLLLEHGHAAARKELETQLLKKQLKQDEEGVTLAFELIDRVEKLSADGNPVKQEIANVVTRSLLGRFLENGGIDTQAENGGASLVDDPFSATSVMSQPPSTDSPARLTSEQPNGAAQLPAPKKVGRPKGSKNKPRSV